MCKIYTDVGGIKIVMPWLSPCTGDNPLAKACRLSPHTGGQTIGAVARDFQQCGMCDQQSLRSACAYAQSDQSLC